MRRTIAFENLNDAIRECERLLHTGYTRTGNWSLGQICCHLRLTIQCNMDGYPRWMAMLGYPLRPLLRWFILPRLLAGESPKGIRTASMFVPPNRLDDDAEVERLKECVIAFLESPNAMHPHPGFGRMTNREFNRFHAAHASHHLSFLHPPSGPLAIDPRSSHHGD
ncbi:DUF1569 domain-containing protein [Candidatus Laterigemmans baculatus]|uniref:DUF1569 domain-containing protein n=1 Tax=Candidatus Laterigemmans baculatus TaxID=2770505 RepID=UPI001F438956|nr:DUF1569 domain-containing protein [Candidatus Laterigemmans baculatus]